MKRSHIYQKIISENNLTSKYSFNPHNYFALISYQYSRFLNLETP